MRRKTSRPNSDRSEAPAVWARRWLSLYATAFAVVVALLIGLVLVIGNGDIGSSEARFALGLNLIASALFTLVFAAFATWVLDRNQRDALDETLQRQGEEVFKRIGELHPRYLPVAEYPASQTFGVAFNQALMESLNGSPVYDFYGPQCQVCGSTTTNGAQMP